MPRARRLLAWLHAWIGAVVAVFVLVLALSGLAIAFAGTLFEWQYPEILVVPEAADARPDAPADVDAMLAAAEAGYGRPIRMLGLLMPGSRIDVGAAMFYGVAEGSDEIVMLGVDPATARFTGSFQLHDAIGHMLIDMHANLLAGEAGATFVAALGLLLVAFAGTGVYLWWPRGRAAWRKLFDVRIGRLNARGLFRLHGLVGIWTALLVLYFALTGSMTAKPDWFGALLSAVPHEAPVSQADAFARRCAGQVTASQAVAGAAAAFPPRTFASLEFPEDDHGAWRLRFKGEGDGNQYEGDGIAWVHASCPGTVATLDAGAAPAAVAVAAGEMMFSLHAGRSFGLAGTVLVCLTCVLLAVIAVSGLLVWWRQYRPRRARRDGRAEGLAARQNT